ncbi:MAG: hypothetical protein IKS52_04655 [Clostridia bacterium]|nr:hypothetical protein [Clostridia bacterium]
MYKITIEGMDEGTKVIECEGFELMADKGIRAEEIARNISPVHIAEIMLQNGEMWEHAVKAMVLLKILKGVIKDDDEHARGEADHDGRDAGGAADAAAEN